MSETFAIVELIGHKRIGGRLIAEPPFAGDLLWLDVFRPDGTYISQGIGRAAIYRATPATEAAARAASDFDPAGGDAMKDPMTTFSDAYAARLLSSGRPGAACLLHAVSGLLTAELTPDSELHALGRSLATAGLAQIQAVRRGDKP